MFGMIADKYGYRAVMLTCAAFLLCVVHISLAYSNGDVILLLVGQGLAYASFAAVVWPSIPLIVPRKYIGLGYGIAFSIQNIGLACFPIVIAWIYTYSNNNYIPNVELFFVSLAASGFTVGLYINYYELTHDSVLNSVSVPVKDVDEEEEGRLSNYSFDLVVDDSKPKEVPKEEDLSVREGNNHLSMAGGAGSY